MSGELAFTGGGPLGDTVVPPPGGSGQGVLSVANTTVLGVLPVTGFVNGTLAYMQSLHDYWSLNTQDTTTPTDGITVVAAASGARWFRLSIPSQFWIQQTDWTIDPINGNDEGDGSAGSPLLTHAEYNRRVGGPTRVLPTGSSDISITMASSGGNIVANIVSAGAVVTYTAALPTQTSDSIASVAHAAPSTRTPFSVTLTTVNWGAQQLVHDTTTDVWWWGYNGVLKVAKGSPPTTLPTTPAAEPVAGHAVDLFPLASFVQLSNFSLTGECVGLDATQPVVVVQTMKLIQGVVSGSVLVDRCALGLVDVRGAYTQIAVSAEDYAAPHSLSLDGVKRTFLAGSLFQTLNVTESHVVATVNNFLSLQIKSALFEAAEVRMMSDSVAPFPSSLFVGNDASLAVTGSLWSDTNASANVAVQDGGLIAVSGAAGTAGFNITTLSIGVNAPNASPRLTPGAVVPARAACGTPAQLFAAPFNGKALDLDTFASIRTP